ncbi:putative NTP pyrophosphohydrolase [Dickeya phage Amaethon]|nr:putative NTP pyrophosphohydrolase [Dickeya phage Amaethon]
MSNEVYNRVAKWNSLRYDRLNSPALTVQLLNEEFTEWRDSVTAVELVDGLCDVIYVAYGALWKHNLSDNQMQSAMYHGFIDVQQFVDPFPLRPAYAVSSFINAYAVKQDPENLAAIIALCYSELYSLGFTEEEAERAVLIVCDSNDSKSVKKTASDIKANDGDKGASFIDPAPRLQALINEVNAREV